MPTIVQSDTSPDRSTATQGMFRAGNERLYDFEKPFDAPAILVVLMASQVSLVKFAGHSPEHAQSFKCIFLVWLGSVHRHLLQLWWKL